MKKEIILIIDLGSPYTQLIAQRVRESHVFSRIVPCNIPAKDIKLLNPRGIILSGGPASISKKKILLPDKGIFNLDIPILGICYGAKIIIQHFGGKVRSVSPLVLQRCELFIDDLHNIFWQMPGNITCLMDCSTHIKKLPRGFKKTAHTQDNPIAAFQYSGKKVFGVNFHPEAIATQRGNQVLSNFLYKVCGCVGSWTMDSFIRDILNNIKKTVGRNKVLIHLDGELNSFVVALLVHKVIGKRLRCIFIDTGLLRLNEARQMKKIFSGNFNLNLTNVDKSQQFIQGLKGVVNPAEKKKIINNLFMKFFEEKVRRPKCADFLAEGTLYSDIIKLGHSPASDNKLKLLKLQSLRPLVDLFEDEIRVLAKELGLSDNLIFRQPFPKEGLAMRIMGEVTPTRLKILRETDACLVEEIKNADIYEQVWKSFAVLIPSQNIIAIRCVASTNGKTADWVRLPYDVLDKIARHIISRVKGISRVVYDVSSKPPATIEW